MSAHQRPCRPPLLSLRASIPAASANIDRRSFAHVFAQLECIPVGEPDAAVRTVLANGLRIRRAVDAIALSGERGWRR
jgi:hypothetical protein